MPTKGTSVRGIRLQDAVWDALDAEAKSLGMTRNEFIGRKLTCAFPVAPEIANPEKNLRDFGIHLQEVDDDDD